MSEWLTIGDSDPILTAVCTWEALAASVLVMRSIGRPHIYCLRLTHVLWSATPGTDHRIQACMQQAAQLPSSLIIPLHSPN